MIEAGDLRILATSFSVALRAVVFALPPAMLAAYALSRPRLPGRSLLDALVHLPLVLPPVLVGFLLLTLLGRQAPLGGFLEQAFGVRLAFSTEGAALAAGVMAFPLMVRAMRLAFEQIDDTLMAAAAVLRAGPWDRFCTIVLPLAAPGVLAAAITGFAAGLGEFGAVITFAANIPGETQTLPLAIYSALQSPGGEARALRLASYSFALAIAALLAGEAVLATARRRRGA